MNRDQNPTLLQVKNLTVCFRAHGGTILAVNDLSFDLNKNQILGIVGESGSGKSVTMQNILGILPKNGIVDPNSQIKFNSSRYGEIDLLKLKPKEKKWFKLRGSEIGIIFQEPSAVLSPIYKIFAYFKEVIDLHLPGKSKTEIEQMAADMLAKVGIPNPSQCLAQYPFELSGGMKQRVLIALTLVTRPKLIIADEPTTALDVTVQAQILRLLKKLQQEFELSIIFISHNLGVIRQIADQVLVMYLGEAMELGLTEDVINRPLHPYTSLLVKAIPHFKSKGNPLVTMPGSIPNPLERPTGCPFHPRCPFVLNDVCSKQHPAFINYENGRKSRCFYLEKHKSRGVPVETHFRN